jgi:hypothetical protein
VRFSGLSKKFAAIALTGLLCVVLFAARAAAQQSTNDQDNATSLIDSIAHSVYAMAWPTATYKSVSIDGFEPADGGFNVIVKLSGLSAFDGSDLWLKLAFLFRNGSLQDVKVRDNNAILVRPFATTQAFASIAVQMAQTYARDQNQGPVPAPQEAPQAQATDRAVPDASSPQAVSAPPAAATPDAATQGSAAQPASAADGYANDIRAYLAAADGGFTNLTVGDPHLSADNVREWTLRAPAGAEINCYAGQVTLPVIDCPIYQSNREDVDLMAGDVAKDLNASLPEGWTSSGDAAYSSDPSSRYVSFSGPSRLWAQLKPAAADASGQYWLEFQIIFPQ